MKMMDAIRIQIQQLCDERGLSITRLSMLCGVTQSTIEGVMKGRNKSTSLSTIQKICDGLDIDLPTFFCEELFLHLDPVERKK